MKETIKYFILLIFFCLFLYFSASSLGSFYNGDVIYDTAQDNNNDKLPFPSMTLCPAMQLNQLVNLKINRIFEDYNIASAQMAVPYQIFSILKETGNLSRIVQDYSFSLKESLKIARPPMAPNNMIV